MDREAITQICQRYRVKSLDLFGSAARGDMGPASDYDFLVEFAPPLDDYADRYFGLKEELEALLGRPVDLVVGKSIRNPYLRRSIEQNRVNVYAA